MKKSADTVLSENLRREMSKRHLSDADIAHRTGFSVGTVQAITAKGGEERESASLSKTQRFAEALGMEVADLLAGKDARAATTTTRTLARSTDDTPKQLGRLIEEFFALPEADRLALLATATEMAAKYRQHISR